MFSQNKEIFRLLRVLIWKMPLFGDPKIPAEKYRRLKMVKGQKTTENGYKMSIFSDLMPRFVFLGLLVSSPPRNAMTQNLKRFETTFDFLKKSTV